MFKSVSFMHAMKDQLTLLLALEYNHPYGVLRISLKLLLRHLEFVPALIDFWLIAGKPVTGLDLIMHGIRAALLSVLKSWPLGNQQAKSSLNSWGTLSMLSKI